MKEHGEMCGSNSRGRPLWLVCVRPPSSRQWPGHSRLRRANVFLGKAHAEGNAASFPAGGIAPFRSFSISDAASLSKEEWKTGHRSVAALSLHGLWTLVSIAGRAGLGLQES